MVGGAFSRVGNASVVWVRGVLFLGFVFLRILMVLVIFGRTWRRVTFGCFYCDF